MKPIWNKSFIIVCFSVLFSAIFFPTAFCIFEQSKNTYVNHNLYKSGDEFDITEDYTKLNVFCRKADQKSIRHYFRTAILRIKSTAEDIQLIRGSSSDEVFKKYQSSNFWMFWAGNLLPWRIRETSMPTFNNSCFGFVSGKEYSLILLIKPVDPWKLLILFIGISLFYSAHKLSRSTWFFYWSGTFVGTLGAVLVILFLFSRMLPKGKLSYIAITALWTMSLYFIGEVYQNFEEFLRDKLAYGLVYITIGAIVSLITCYRFGPPSNFKTLNIIEWLLKAAGLFMVHFSSDLVEVSTTIIIGMVILSMTNLFPLNLNFLWKQWRIMFPKKIKLLTEEEFMAQGQEETKKELEKLKVFCSSPKCNSWKIVGKLRNPRRFSEFMNGSFHLSDDELMAYDSENSVTYEDEETDEELEVEEFTNDATLLTDDESSSEASNLSISDDEDNLNNIF